MWKHIAADSLARFPLGVTPAKKDRKSTLLDLLFIYAFSRAFLWLALADIWPELTDTRQ